MNKEIVQGFLEQEVQAGKFGAYLMKPMSGKERAKMVGYNMMFCRKKAGLSQRDVCTIIDCAPQTYSGYENGKHEPTIETLVRLSHLYQVSLDFLLQKYQEEERPDIEYQNIEDNPTFQEVDIQMQVMIQRIEELEKHIKIGEDVPANVPVRE